MQEAYLSISLVKGDCYSARFVPRFGEDEHLADFTGFGGEVSFTWSGGEIALTPGAGLTMGGAEGWMEFALTNEETAMLPDGQQSEIRIRVTEPSGCPVTLAAGPVEARI